MHPVYQECRKGNLILVKEYMSEPTYPEPDRTTDPTLLIIACRYNRPQIALYLLSEDNPHQKDVIRDIDRAVDAKKLHYSAEYLTSVTALDEAAHHDNLEVIKRLLFLGAKYTFQKSGWTPLWQASKADHTEIVRFLLSKDNPSNHTVYYYINVSVSRGYANQSTALNMAYVNDNVAMFSLLLCHGARCAHQPPRWTTLWQAVRYGAIQIARFLLNEANPATYRDVVANINAVVSDGQGPNRSSTALDQAHRRQNVELTKLLLTHGARYQDEDALIELMQVGGKSVIEYSLSGSNPGLKHLLQSVNTHYIPRNRRERISDPVNPLALACNQEHTSDQTIAILLAAGATLPKEYQNTMKVNSPIKRLLLEVFGQWPTVENPLSLNKIEKHTLVQLILNSTKRDKNFITKKNKGLIENLYKLLSKHGCDSALLAEIFGVAHYMIGLKFEKEDITPELKEVLFKYIEDKINESCDVFDLLDIFNQFSDTLAIAHRRHPRTDNAIEFLTDARPYTSNQKKFITLLVNGLDSFVCTQYMEDDNLSMNVNLYSDDEKMEGEPDILPSSEGEEEGERKNTATFRAEALTKIKLQIAGVHKRELFGSLRDT